MPLSLAWCVIFFFQAEDGIRDLYVTGVQTCALRISFSYSEKGPQGLVTGKQVIVVAARGGIYSGAGNAFDFQLPYLKSVLGFLGMTDVEVLEVRSEERRVGKEGGAQERPDHYKETSR